MKRFLIYITLVAMAFVYAPRTSAQSVLFDNGPLTADTDRCDSGPGVCLGSGNWTVFDDFNLNSTSNVTQIDFVSLLSFGDISDYIETNWSIWDSDPLTAAAPIFSGTTVGNAVDLGGGAYQFELSVNFTLTTGWQLLVWKQQSGRKSCCDYSIRGSRQRSWCLANRQRHFRFY